MSTPSPLQSPDLSIVITAHNEGLIAHKTMLSLADALDKAERASISYEVLISIDSGSKETKDYFSRYRHEPSYRLLTVDFHSLSDSRNNAVQKARGKYIAFLDADDLVSANWLTQGYLVAKEQQAIAHPEYSITFGDDDLIWKKESSGDTVLDTLKLIDNNLWDSPCIAQRDIFIAHPYVANGNGFGFEDKQFNSETIADGIPHVVAPQTLLFVRRKITGSMLTQAVADRVTLAPTKLLSYDRIASLDISAMPINSAEQSAPIYEKVLTLSLGEGKRVARKLHHRAKRSEAYLRLVEPLREKRKAHLIKRLDATFPEWMLAEWRRIHRIDNAIFPSRQLLQHLPWYNAQNIIPGLAYTRLIQTFSSQPDTLVFVPWLIKGGADMLFINYSNELARLHPDWHLAVLQTEHKESLWRNKLSGDIDFIDLFKVFEGLDFDTQSRLLATLLTQNGVKRVIIGNSQLAYDFVSKYQTLIKRLNIAVYCFAFGEEFDEEGRLWGHIHTGIPRIYPVIHRIITDNKNTVDKLEREYAFERDKFRTHYQPTDVTVEEPVAHDHRPLKVLWASRVCKQKRPDILKQVSNLLSPTEFTFEAYGQLEEGLTAEYFNDSRVRYRGAFNGMPTIPTHDYDIFLYTSEGDGVPNILQEITASGLPIVASNVGGIKEFVKTGKTGFLIEDHNDIAAYVAAIQQLKDAHYRQKLVNGAQQLLRTQFSHDAWTHNIATDFDR